MYEAPNHHSKLETSYFHESFALCMFIGCAALHVSCLAYAPSIFRALDDLVIKIYSKHPKPSLYRKTEKNLWHQTPERVSRRVCTIPRPKCQSANDTNHARRHGPKKILTLVDRGTPSPYELERDQEIRKEPKGKDRTPTRSEGRRVYTSMPR